MASQERQEKLERLLLAYKDYFDIDREVPEGEGVFCASAKFHSRSEKYVLVKKAQIWAMEQNEYVYFSELEHLDLNTLNSLFEKARDCGMAQIKPHSEHMYSYVTLIILADSIDPEAAEALKKIRFQKSFWLSLHGWMEFRIAAVDFSGSTVISNKPGKSVRVLLEQNLRLK